MYWGCPIDERKLVLITFWYIDMVVSELLKQYFSKCLKFPTWRSLLRLVNTFRIHLIKTKKPLKINMWNIFLINNYVFLYHILCNRQIFKLILMGWINMLFLHRFLYIWLYFENRSFIKDPRVWPFILHGAIRERFSISMAFVLIFTLSYVLVAFN